MINYENVGKGFYDGVGYFDIPKIQPVYNIPAVDWIPCNCAVSAKDKDKKGVHFYTPDEQFARFWTNCDKYTEILKKFGCVMSPDFSLYLDMPRAMQIYNVYRKHWLAAWWQEHGISVIPTISWSTPDSFSWCFDGEPVGGIVSVSSVGCMKREKSRRAFVEGYNEMLARLQPKEIIFYGIVPEECRGNITNIRPFYEGIKNGKNGKTESAN